MAHGTIPLSIYRSDVDTLRAGNPQVVAAIGEQSSGQPIYATGMALAEKLGVEPVMFPGDDGARRAAQVADHMLANGVYVIAFSFPVVPRGRARIRVQLSAAHSEADVRACVDAFAAARDAGAELFFVPADNCNGIGGVDLGDMRLAKATTMHRAVETLSDWVADADAPLPSCEDTAS